MEQSCRSFAAKFVYEKGGNVVQIENMNMFLRGHMTAEESESFNLARTNNVMLVGWGHLGK